MKIYKIDDGEQHWIAAKSEEDAINHNLEWLGMSVEEYQDDLKPEVQILPDDQVLTVYDPDDSVTHSHTAREWAEMAEGETTLIGSSCL